MIYTGRTDRSHVAFIPLRFEPFTRPTTPLSASTMMKERKLAHWSVIVEQRGVDVAAALFGP